MGTCVIQNLPPYLDRLDIDRHIISPPSHTSKGGSIARRTADILPGLTISPTR
jgi:hypothetical protein